MPNFFLIDPSLSAVGSHHFDYAEQVAEAAGNAGFLTTVGANRRLPARVTINQARVQRDFRHCAYSPYALTLSGRPLARRAVMADHSRNNPRDAEGLVDTGGWRQRRIASRRGRLVMAFAQDCAQLMRDVLLTDRDHALVATATDLQLLGLAAYLANHPRTLQVTWHVLFHFDLLSGRPPQYASQRHVQNVVRHCFRAALSRVPYHRIHFYATTEQLARQYQRLNCGEFRVLPYPVNQEFLHSSAIGADSEPAPGSAVPPLRITCAGGVRREKGQRQMLQPIVEQVAEPLLQSGRAVLVVQDGRRRLWRRSPVDALRRELHNSATAAAVQRVPHPLSKNDYIQLVRHADIGLLTYDSLSYYSRRAGIMGEFLACGIPVVVPAGCWLGDQLAEETFRHVDRCTASNPVTELAIDINRDPRNVPLPGGVYSFNGDRLRLRAGCELLEGCTNLAIRFDWHWPIEPGTYARIAVQVKDGSGSVMDELSQVVGHRRGDAQPAALFPIPTGGRTAELEFRNAFGESSASIKRLQLFAVRSQHGQPLPRAAVGLSATTATDFARCLLEIADQYEHYRNTAGRFAAWWRAQHDPRRTIECLTQQRPPASMGKLSRAA